MTAKVSKTSIIKDVTIYISYLILVWVFYRFLFKFPDDIEELVIKPVLWLVPIFYFIRKEKEGLSSLGITFKKFFPAVYLSLGLGTVFVIEGLITNYLKYGSFNFGANIGNLPLMSSLGLSFATAFSEETAFRGYIYSRLGLVFKSDWVANLVQATAWTAIHVPIAFFVWKLNLSAALVYLLLTFIFGVGSAFIFGRTKNVFGSIFLHVLWEWPIILFR
ncbi:MAG TPA: CPBP family intramembrane glutamic endopeptidase [Patescibacteria group bacterium]|nr:CPBP family intramembrane glutamic endopeptidase [Patescibacteria group bacterium]